MSYRYTFLWFLGHPSFVGRFGGQSYARFIPSRTSPSVGRSFIPRAILDLGAPDKSYLPQTSPVFRELQSISYCSFASTEARRPRDAATQAALGYVWQRACGSSHQRAAPAWESSGAEGKDRQEALAGAACEARDSPATRSARRRTLAQK